MDAEEMYEKVCKPKQDEIVEGQKEIKAIAESTYKAICVSNGKACVLARLDKLEGEARDNDITTKFGIKFKPIESRDLAGILIAFGVVMLVLERFGALQPLIEWVNK